MDEMDIREKIKNGEYESKVPYPKTRKYMENHIFDEEQSVKWNREQVISRNEWIEEEIESYREAQDEKDKEFEEDVITYILDEFNINGNKKIAEKIFSQAYWDGHHGGYNEILSKVMNLANFVEELLKEV